MPLSLGARLGSYEVISPLGSGGMGEVYRARDTKLDRDVAIKILPESFALDADRVARFVREAKMLASLNHPNIAAIYGIEEAGPSTGSGQALVMELVEGEDLSQVIARGSIPFVDALPIARQIADALEAAHEQGIIHRDLKPANIKIKSDGTVKVLDFGLAKAATSADASESAIANSPTLTARATQMGMIIGTAAYMSPEQAKGRAVDKRADIWAFGAVLYEMLTGERPFKGDDVSETLASVIEDTPNLAALPSSTPPRVRALLERCLERDVKMRLRDIGDARVELTKAASGQGEFSSPGMATSVSVPAPARARWRGPMGLAAMFVLGAAGTLAILRPWQALTSSTTVTKFLIATADPPDNLALSPNGKRLLIEAGGKMYVRDVDQIAVREIAGLGILGTGTLAAVPTWSADSASIAYGSAGKVWRVGLAGGAPSLICDVPGVLQSLLWKSDDTIVMTLTRGPMYQVSANGGDPRVLLPLDGKDDVDFHVPSVLPDGQTLIYAVHRREGVDTIEALSGGTRHVLLRLEGRALEGPQVLNRPMYSPTGHLIYKLEQGNAGVWAVPFSLRELKTTGEPFLIAAGADLPTLAADGTLAYTPPTPSGPRQLVMFRRDGSIERTIGVARKLLRQPSLSPDGRRIVYVADDTNTDVWVMNADGSGDTRITFTPGNEVDPVWVPGENAVAFSCPASGGGAICLKAADGSGDVRVIAAQASWPVFSPDGRYLLMQSNGRAQRGLLSLDRQGPDGQPVEYVTAAAGLEPVAILAGNRFAVYWNFSGNRPVTTVKPFPSGSGYVGTADATELECHDVSAGSLDARRTRRSAEWHAGGGRRAPEHDAERFLRPTARPLHRPAWRHRQQHLRRQR